MNHNEPGFDRGAAITRSLLGWGVVAGPFYLAIGLVLAATRSGFDLSRHPLSLLMLGPWGWLQRTNLVLAALMTIIAALGMYRAVRDGRGLAMSVLTGCYGAGMLLSAAFPPDPVAGFPAGDPVGTGEAVTAMTLGGTLRFLFGGIAFLAVAAAALSYARWAGRIGERAYARAGTALAALIVAGFLIGAAMGTSPLGIGLLWAAVVCSWAWLALACAHFYRWTPHPVIAERREADRRL
ncbi:MAG TPA: DUF998 domain-containing protein [Beutenbergiaceae bacterium]|nr:DUF998 domain-containing protein [Beutenbergiaceae bacterium]